jgi:hypothetical protein
MAKVTKVIGWSLSGDGDRVRSLTPVKFWGVPELYFEALPGRWEFAEKFEFYRNIGCIERFINFGDRAPLLDYIKNGDLNTDKMREFFSALVLDEVSAPVGNPATFEKHKMDLRIARFVAVLIAFGGRPMKVYDLAGRRFGANQHHAYSSKQIKRIFDEHRDEAWDGVAIIKGAVAAMHDKGLIEGDLTGLIRARIMGVTQITKEDIRSTSAKTARRQN